MSELQETLDAVQASGLSDRDKARICRMLRLQEKSAGEMDYEELAAARLFAGLSAGQAAVVLKVSPFLIRDWEAARLALPRTLVAAVDEAYGTGQRLKRETAEGGG